MEHEKYQITLGVDSKEKFKLLFEKSQKIWKELGVYIKGNREANKVINEITEKIE